METQIHLIAALAYVDKRLDELEEDFGDLPEIVSELEQKIKKKRALVEETKGILSEIKKFCSTTKVTLVELKSKEEKLAKQQFQVRNNKEFDAISKEIEHLKDEHSRLTDQLRTEGVKEENLLRILDEQKVELEIRIARYDDKKSDLDLVSNDQNEEVNNLKKLQKGVLKKIKKNTITEYNRIRGMHKDAAVNIKRNSCTGCFSAVPPQIIVEIRNSMELAYFCENCGRILLPEDIIMTEEAVKAII